MCLAEDGNEESNVRQVMKAALGNCINGVVLQELSDWIDLTTTPYVPITHAHRCGPIRFVI